MDDIVFIEKEILLTFFEEQFRGKLSSFHQSGVMKMFAVRSQQFIVFLMKNEFGYILVLLTIFY